MCRLHHEYYFYLVLVHTPRVQAQTWGRVFQSELGSEHTNHSIIGRACGDACAHVCMCVHVCLRAFVRVCLCVH